jgi:acetaldehyde dehydrogenase (acetylating)
MNLRKATAAIVGPGNIGTDLLAKPRPSTTIDVRYMVGVVESNGLARARARGVASSAEGVDWLLRQDPLPEIVFEATSAKAHIANAPRYAEADIQAVDRTPAHLGPMVCPPVNLRDYIDAPSVSTSSPAPPAAPSPRSAVPPGARRSLSPTRSRPQFDEPRESWSGHARVAVFLEVKGNGDYLPPYAANLDLMTAAAARVGELMALRKIGVAA